MNRPLLDDPRTNAITTEGGMMHDQQTSHSRKGLRATASAVMTIRVSVLAAAVAAAVVALAPGARADTPMCDEVVNAPTLVTCTCICEASSSFPGCQGQEEGTAAPTPNQCPDMLQGRRVISGGDALVVADPHKLTDSQNPLIVYDTRVLLYQTENDASNPGLGVPAATPAFTGDTNMVCSGITDQPYPQQTRFARLFDLPYDMEVTLRPTNIGSINSDCGSSDGLPNLVFDVRDLHVHAGELKVPLLEATWNPQWVQLAIDDFNYDGFDDILFLNIDSIQMVTAVDASNPTQGLVHVGGVTTTLSSGAFRVPLNEPTTGDFNGDGLLDVAWIGGDVPHNAGTMSVSFATICPGDVTGTICAGAEPFEVILGPASRLFSGGTSTIELTNAPLTKTACGVVQNPNNPSHPIQTDSLRAGTVEMGNFEDNGFNPRGAPIDELVVAYVSGSNAVQGDLCLTNVEYYSFSPSTSSHTSWATLRDSTSNIFPEVHERHTASDQNDVLHQYMPVINLQSQAAYLDWYGPVEQVVIALSGVEFSSDCDQPECPASHSWYYPVTVSVTGTGDEAQAHVCTALAGGSGDRTAPLFWGLAVGRLSTSTTVNPDNPSTCGDFSSAAPGDCPYNPQIAMLLAGNVGNTTKPTSLRLYNVRETSQCAFEPEFFEAVEIDGYSATDISNLRGGSYLQAGDAFGNSVRVGNPTITRISQHTQPQMVIQTPPSLIDYVLPNEEDSTSAAIVNFTRAPDNFNTQIQFATESQDTSATSQTTSHSTSFTESISGEVKFKVPLVSSIDIKNKESWSQFHESNTSSQFSNYVSTALETGGTIGGDDQVWWTQTTFNVFHFPVIGQTICPASLTCDNSDPANIVCDGGGSSANAVALTCAPDSTGEGCDCLSQGASTSLCPAIPTEADQRNCTEQGGDICCTQLQQQLYMTLSGPEEVTRKSQQGATSEFYHPKHEPGQILSYPSNLLLLQARLPNPQELATLDAFSTGTNSQFETITYSSSCEASQGTGTTTRHSFESDTSITAGTPKLEEAEGGATVTASFDYGSSTSTDTLNSYTVGQTSSSSVQLNLQGAGFLNPDQYAYDVEGIVYGQVQPDDVLDTPDLTVCPITDPSTDSALCNDANKEAAGCTTTGPLQVAYAADPTAGDGGWWSSAAPYLKDIDVALNNPSRWRSVNADQVADPDLQCRGPIDSTTCYTVNQPPTGTAIDASSVWDADFYDLKGLLVTIGATIGHQRDSATVGDEIFLQLRVSNYSLIGTATQYPGSTVHARFYRQQLDVNALSDDNFAVGGVAADASGQPLPAVPIGPTGLGDSDPIPVVSPQDGTATIPPFNTSSDPANDNISLATTSYTAIADDACEFDNGQQTCTGAYYAYWVTVWIQDASDNVLTELPGHGLGADFDPTTGYAFITDVPLETVTFNSTSTTFSSNVGMFKKVFAILPASDDALAAAGPQDLALNQVRVTPEQTVLGRPVVVSAQVVSLGAATPGVTVVFTAGDPATASCPTAPIGRPPNPNDARGFVRIVFSECR